MLLLVASLLTTAAAFPFEITPQPLFPVPDPTPAEPCGLAARGTFMSETKLIVNFIVLWPDHIDIVVPCSVHCCSRLC